MMLARSHYTKWLQLLIIIIHNTVSTPIPHHQHHSHFLKQRCNKDKKPALWFYRGTLTDHDTGRIIAAVEGIELVGLLPSSIDAFDANHLKLSAGSPGCDSSNTILSRKLFCYKHQNKDELLSSIRLRPDGPLRYLEPYESTAVYDSAVTFLSRGDEMILYSDRGSTGSNVMGIAEPSMTQNDIEYTVQARASHDEELLLPIRKSTEATISPQRSRWIQFGKSPEVKRYDAVRETYTYSFPNEADADPDQDFDGRFKWKKLKREKTKSNQGKQATVRYTRYGEAPPWYAPGRMCTLELIGKKVDLQSTDLSEVPAKLPPLLQWATSKCTPSFWTGWPAALQSCNNEEAIRLFRTESPRLISYDMQRTQSPLQARVEDALNRLHGGMERVKGSLIFDNE